MNAEFRQEIRYTYSCDGSVAANKVLALVDENERLETALRVAREELTHWGWGDFHYGSQPQEKRVLDAIAAIDAALVVEGQSLSGYDDTGTFALPSVVVEGQEQ